MKNFTQQQPIGRMLQKPAAKNHKSIDDQLLDLYWAKKELEDFLPGLSKHKSSGEICAITLAQLQNMEKTIVQLLQSLAQSES